MTKGKTLYLECYAGISGDMTVGALLDLGADEQILQDAIHSLPLEGYTVEISRVKKSGIDACDFNVKLDAAHENHDHDMEYLHGHGVEHHHHDEYGHHHDEHHHDQNEHHHDHDDHHHHDGDTHSEACHRDEVCHHDEHHHHHEHRGIQDVKDIILAGNLTDNARKLAISIFEILTEAEAKAHNVAPQEVHFHEVGAVDSIIDIVSVAVCLDNLKITSVIVPILYEGTGTVRCQHGILPIPVPATANIMEAHRLPVRFMETEGEFVTPTGAAIIAAVMTDSKLPDTFTIEKIGIGAGKRTYERPSMLRAMLIHENMESAAENGYICKLESNIDDCSGEVLGYTMEQLFAAGARDVHYTPVFMKKNRPGWMLSVICREQDIAAMEQIIFHETTTIGIRRMKLERSALKRECIQVNTTLGEAQVKVCELRDEKRYYPEYDSVVKLCRESGKSYMEVYSMVVQACEV